MLVLDEDASMVDVTRYFLDFLSNESFGKCVPCREDIMRKTTMITAVTLPLVDWAEMKKARLPRNITYKTKISDL